MKKLLFRLVLILVVLVILAIVGVGLFLDNIVKKAVETAGPVVTKTDVKLQSASLSLFTGSGALKGLVVGNPQGFKSPSALSLGLASLSIDPSSLLTDKIVVKSIVVQAPEITFETDLQNNNLSKLLAGMKGSGDSGTKTTPEPAPSGGPSKKLQVDEFVMTGAKLHVSVTGLAGAAGAAGLGAQSATVSMAEIRLKDLGKGPDGITPASLATQVLEVVLEEATKQAASVVADLGKGATYMSKEAGTNAVEKAAKGLGDLFKKK